jgi:hypothetical protein
MVALGLTAGGAALAQPPSAVIERACYGVPASQWDGSPILAAQTLRGVQEIKPDAPVSEAETVVPRAGARLLLRATPGMTAEWMQRIAECHMAQVAAAPPWTLTSSPLDVKGALVSVQSSGDGFTVDITSPDIKVARDILNRAKALVPPPPPRAR